jgi:ketosteroid isomerase-like protein
MNLIEDELALRNLMARYVDAVNRCDAEAWIATWAEDSVWNLLGNPVQGRDNILALWRQMMGTFEFALLLPSSCLFEVDGDSASGHWYLHEYSRDLQGNRSAIISRYDDSYTRVDGQWLFASRSYHFIYNGPPDLGGEFTRSG